MVLQHMHSSVNRRHRKTHKTQTPVENKYQLNKEEKKKEKKATQKEKYGHGNKFHHSPPKVEWSLMKYNASFIN